MVDGFDTTILLLPLTAILLGCLAAVWRMLPERAGPPSRLLLTVLPDGRIVERVVPASRDDAAGGRSLAGWPWFGHAATDDSAGGLRTVLSLVWRRRRADSRRTRSGPSSDRRARTTAPPRGQCDGPRSSSPIASTSGHVRLRRFTADAPAGDSILADQAPTLDSTRVPASNGSGASLRTS